MNIFKLIFSGNSIIRDKDIEINRLNKQWEEAVGHGNSIRKLITEELDSEFEAQPQQTLEYVRNLIDDKNREINSLRREKEHSVESEKRIREIILEEIDATDVTYSESTLGCVVDLVNNKNTTIDHLKNLCDSRYNELAEYKTSSDNRQKQLNNRIVNLEIEVSDANKSIERLEKSNNELESKLEKAHNVKFATLIKNIRNSGRAREIIEMLEHKLADFE